MKLLKFSSNLKIALNEQNLTQQDLANYIGTTQQTISRWLKGINEPDLGTFLEICLYLNETPNALLGYDDISDNDFKAYQQDKEVIEENRKRALIDHYEEQFK